jgi:hypothetical protein
LTGPAAVQLGLDIVFTQLDTGGAAINDGPNAFAMGLTECGHAEDCAECTGHGFLPRFSSYLSFVQQFKD